MDPAKLGAFPGQMLMFLWHWSDNVGSSDPTTPLRTEEISLKKEYILRNNQWIYTSKVGSLYFQSSFKYGLLFSYIPYFKKFSVVEIFIFSGQNLFYYRKYSLFWIPYFSDQIELFNWNCLIRKLIVFRSLGIKIFIRLIYFWSIHGRN